MYYSLILKTTEKENGDIRFGNSFGTIKDFFSRQYKLSDTDTAAIIAYNNEFNRLSEIVRRNGASVSNYTIAQRAANKTMGNASEEARNMVKNANNNVVAFNDMTKSSKAAALGMNALVTASNMALNMAIAFAVSKAIEGIDYLIHFEERQQEAFENAKAAVEESAGAIRDIKSGMSDTSSKASELSLEFANLVQGVDPFTNENKGLSTESYERFLEVNSQLSELFPSLTKNYDENGNAILGLSGDVDTVTASIAKLVEQQNNLAKAEIREQLGAYVEGSDGNEGIFQVLYGQKREISDAEDNLEKLKNTYNDIMNMQGRKVISGKNNELNDYLDFVENNLGQRARKSLEKATTAEHHGQGIDSYTIDFSKLELSETDKSNISDSYDNFYHDMQTTLSIKQSELKAKNQEMSEMMMTWVGDLDLYKDSDARFQKVIESMVGNLQWSELGVEDGDIGAAKQLIQSLVLSPLSAACEEPDTNSMLMKSINNLFTLDFSQMSYKDANKKINDLLTPVMEAINKNIPDKQQKKSLADMYSLFNLEEYSKTNSRMNWNLANISPRGSYDYYKLTNYTQGFTKEQTEKWLSATNGATNADDAIRRYEKSINTPSPSFTEVWTSLDTTEDESLKTLKDDLLALAQAGQLTLETFRDTRGSDNFLANLGIEPNSTREVQEVIGQVNELVSSTDQLASMEKGISGLTGNLYAKQQDPGSAIGAETFTGMDSGLKAQTAEWNNYVNVLGNASSSLSEVQAATNKLATAYIGSNNFLANLTETNKGYYISQLDAMGIDNAEELVQQKLTAKYQIQDLSLKALALTKDGINEDSINSVINLMDEANAVDEVKYAIMDCIIQEQIFSENSDLGVNDKRDQLKELIEYYYGAADAAAFANAVTVGNDGTGKGGAQNHYETLTPQQELENLKEAHKNEDRTPIQIRTLPRASTGGSTPQKTQTPETFNFIETAITRIKSRIDEAKNAAKEAFQSFKDRGKSYANAISEIAKQIDTQNKAEEKYLKKANSVGLEEKYVSQIQNGSLDIETITDEDLKKRIREYKEWYEKALACREAVRDLKKEQEALARERIELTITKYDKLSAKAQANKDRSQANIEYKEARGLMASAKDYAKINAANGKQISYYRSMNAELSKLQKTVPKGSQAWREYQERIDANNKSIVELKKNIFETAAATAALVGKKAEKKAAKKDSRNEFLDAKLSNQTNTYTKNDIINSKIQNIKDKKKFYNTAVSDDKKNIRKSSQKLKNFKQTSKNKALLKKIRACVKSKKKISSNLLDAAAKLNDNGKLLAACTTYNAHRDALERDRETANLFAETSRTEIADLVLEKFSNASEKWDNTLYKNTQKETELNSQIGINESSGKKKDNLNIYQSLVANEEDKKENLTKKRKELQKRLNKAVAAGNIKEGSSQWLQMTQEIDGVTNAINEAAQSIINYNKAYHSLQWDLFDDAMETMERINNEADYYIDMMADEELTDKDTGSLTEYGKAALKLYQNNYQAYLAQAEQYKKEYNKLMGQIQKGELDGADPDVIARKRELEDKIQEKNLAANQTLQKQKELVKDLYDTQLEKISSLISKYKELMSTEKDAYEYQRTIEQKVKDLASLQKRMDAYSTNDDTEENRARIQKIKMELAEAKQDLKDTQYDKYLSDTENMLDEMYDDMESFFDEKLDNTDFILESIAELLGTDNEAIITTLKSIDDGLSSTLAELINGTQTNSQYASETTTEAKPAPPAQNTNGKNNEPPTGDKNTDKKKNSSQTKKSAQDNKSNQKKTTSKKTATDKKASSNKKAATIKSVTKKTQTAEQIITSKPERYTKEVVLNTAPAKDTPKKPTETVLESLPPRRNISEHQLKENLLGKAVINSDNPLLNFDPTALFQEAYLAPAQNSLPKTLPTQTGSMGMQNISIDLGGITMYGVNDPKTFGKQLREEICQNGQTTKCITEAVISNAMGNGIGNAKFYQR